MNNHVTKRASFYLCSQRFVHNLQIFGQYHPISKLTPVLKANAYGHGIAHILAMMQGGPLTTYAVTTLAECFPYLSGSLTPHILHGPMSIDELKYDDKVQFVISLPWQIKMLQTYGKARKKRYWLKVELGLNRLGFSLEQARSLLRTHPDLWCGIYGHLGAIVQYPQLCRQRASQLKQLAKEFSLPLSLENTEGLAVWNQGLFGDYIRLGLSFYGYAKGKPAGLLPLGRLVCPILKTFPSRRRLVGYDWYERTQGAISLVALGYGDGLSPHLTGALIDSDAFKVCSPMMMDLCYLEHQNDKVSDDRQIITWFGRSCQELHSLASYLKVKPYVLLSQLSTRVLRCYNNNGVLDEVNHHMLSNPLPQQR